METCTILGVGAWGGAYGFHCSVPFCAKGGGGMICPIPFHFVLFRVPVTLYSWGLTIHFTCLVLIGLALFVQHPGIIRGLVHYPIVRHVVKEKPPHKYVHFPVKVCDLCVDNKVEGLNGFGAYILQAGGGGGGGPYHCGSCHEDHGPSMMRHGCVGGGSGGLLQTCDMEYPQHQAGMSFI